MVCVTVMFVFLCIARLDFRLGVTYFQLAIHIFVYHQGIPLQNYSFIYYKKRFFV